MRGEHIYPDEYIEHYAKRYLALGLKAQGFTLLVYLAAPAPCEALAKRYAHGARGIEPLLLPQEIAREAASIERRRRVEAGVTSLPRRGGWATEKLRHHSRRAVGWSQRRLA